MTSNIHPIDIELIKLQFNGDPQASFKLFCNRLNHYLWEYVHNSSFRVVKGNGDKPYFRITNLSAVYTPNSLVSNSHSCPRDGVENWGRREGRPTGYQGISGRIEYESNLDIAHSVLRPSGINTGTGGGGISNGYKTGSYDVKIFAMDYPIIQDICEYYNLRTMEAKLSGMASLKYIQLDYIWERDMIGEELSTI